MEGSRNSDPVAMPSTSSRLRRWRVGVSIGLVVLSAGVYANSLANPFMYDDRSIIVEDARVQQGDWLALLTGRYWHLPSATRHYRPLIGLSYAINHALSPEPWGYRAANLILHAGTSVVLFLFALELFGSLYVAAAAGTFFAIHPVHTEALNAIVGRADLVVALGSSAQRGSIGVIRHRRRLTGLDARLQRLLPSPWLCCARKTRSRSSV